MTDLMTMIKAQKMKWIKLYLNNHKCLWRNTMEHLINVDNLNLLLRSNYDIKVFQITSVFYKEVLSTLHSLNKENMNFTKSNLINQYLFYNKNIKLVENLCMIKRCLMLGFGASKIYLTKIKKSSNL